MKNINLLCALVPLWLTPVAFAGTQVFSHTARIVMGSRETMDDCREFGKLEARRAVLEQVGVYIEGQSDFMQTVRETATSFSDSTSLRKRVLAIAAGVTQLDVTGEEWKTENGSLVLYLTCAVTVDPEDVQKRLNELAKDRQKIEDYERVQEEVGKLREELTGLREDLERAKSEAQIAKAKEGVKGAVDELTAAEWFNKGLDADEPDDKIACFTLSIQLNPNWSRPYIHRGFAHQNRGDTRKAIADFSRFLEFEPEDADAYVTRAAAYALEEEYASAVKDCNTALQINPNQGDAYSTRAVSYCMIGRDYDAMADCASALKINENDPQAFLAMGLVFINTGNRNAAKKCFQRAAELGSDAAWRVLGKMR